MDKKSFVSNIFFIILALSLFSFSQAGAQCNDDTDCGLCEKCVSTVCEFQTTSEDTKNECSDVEACLTSYCDGAGACGFEPATTECRASAGACDIAETCTGSSASCPTDAKSTAECRASADVCDIAEVCDGVSNDCPVDSFEPDTTECRASAGACDVADYCTGSSASCPADAKSTAECRASADVCDIAEVCDGVSNDCPVDSFEPDTTECRASAGDCDIVENCTGSLASCPVDAKSTAECRASADVCDIAEVCDGVSNDCPVDSFEPDTTECRASAGACDVADYCTGSSASCPADAKSTAECRASADVCDIAEVCDGVSNDCPVDSFEPDTTECRASAGDCDIVENCTGSLASCPVDAKSTAECRASADVCDIAEVCDGVSNDCPVDSFEPDTTECRASAGDCDIVENCTGSSASCPTDLFEPDSTICRSSTGECDPEETCSGSTANCPADYQIEYSITLSPDPLNLGSPGEYGVMTALVEESSVAVTGEEVTFWESADPNSAVELSPMAELDINGEAVVQIHGLLEGSGTLSVTALDGNGDAISGVTYTLGNPVDSGCATLNGSTLDISSNAPCDTEMTVTCDDGVDPIVGYLIATIDPSSTAVTVEVVPVTYTSGEARILVEATGEGQATVSGSVTCGTAADTATVNVTACNDDTDCGLCEKCVSTVCEFQTTSEDRKNECSDVEACLTSYCDGAGACGFEPATTECRASAGDCDIAETCTGSSASCPADAKSTAECRASADVCDIAEVCDGVSNDCPVDSFEPATTECRASAGDCDIAETCTGSSASCPADAKSTAECRASADVCDIAEVCDGVSNDCPVDSFEPDTTECRASAGACDVADYCTGSSASCPTDAKSTAECRASADVCDIAEVCDGVSNDCPVDSFEPDTTECRASAGACDIAETCTGSSASCPTDLFEPDSTICRSSTGECDPEETCSGSTATCPADYQIEYSITLSPDPLNLGSPGEYGVMTALVEESSVAVTGEEVTFWESADPNSAVELSPMAELDINGEAVVQIHGLLEGSGTLSVTALDGNGDAISGVTYTLGNPVDSGCATLNGSTLDISSNAPCDTEMTVTCDDGVDPIVGYLIATIDPSSTAVTVEVVPVTDTSGEARILVEATGEGQATVSGSVTCGTAADTATVNVTACNDDTDCGLCEKCVANVCEFQLDSEDTKNECSDVEACLTSYCDGAGACAFEPDTTECRASVGACDVADYCTGSSASCPADAKSTAECRASADVCDIAEVCDGVSNDCPVDSFEPDTTECRASAGACDVADYCTGSSASCPADAKSTAECRASADVCDIAEVCDGVSNDCPVDSFEPDTTECRASVGACDIAETCTGSSASCPVDAKSTAECRASADVCDIAEVCDGVSNDCPVDSFEPDTTECRASAGACDVADYCTGSSATCPADAKSTAECRASAGVCDTAESCDGINDDCPADAKSTAECRASAGVCDIEESCDGVSNDCPPDAFEPATTVCRTTAGECDVAENCTGISTACPVDDFKTAGTLCTDDGNVCTDDECDGTGNCVHPNNTAPCDDGITCTHTDICSGGTCSGTAYSCNDSNVCTDDICNGDATCSYLNNSNPCDDGYFCNGSDTCSGGSCSIQAGDPCQSDPHHPHCDDTIDKCICWTNEECEDYLWCNGDDTCDGGGSCIHSGNPCVLPAICDEDEDRCVAQWARTYGTNVDDFAQSIQQTSDGGYIVGGYARYFGADDAEFWALELTSNGDINWQKTYGGNNIDKAASIQQTSDGGYILAGFLYSADSKRDCWVLKLDDSGSVSWQKTYGESESDAASSIQQTSDGGYVVAGYTESFGDGDAELWVLKLESDGDVDWQKTYNGGSDDEDSATSIQQTSDGGYIVAGYTRSFGGYYDADFWVLKLDDSGFVAWQKTYDVGNYSDDSATSIQQTSDGGYVVAGYTESFSTGDADFLVLKLLSNGEVSWQKTYGGINDDVASSIQQTSDGGYVVAGYTESFSTGDADFLVLKLLSNGEVSWQNIYGGINDDVASSIQQTSDGGYVVAGYTESFGTGDADFMVLKLDSNGEIHNCDIIAPSDVDIHATSVSGVDTEVIGYIYSAIDVYDTGITPYNSSAMISNVCYPDPNDLDGDGMSDYEDNCPELPNGPDLGTCVKLKGDMMASYRVGGDFIICTSDGDCIDTDGTCQLEQGDCNENGIGDVCECYTDSNEDGKVTAPDYALLKTEFGRYDCPLTPGSGTGDTDGDGVMDEDDNCPEHPNASSIGTCVKLKGDMMASYRVGGDFIICTSDGDCIDTNGTCQLEQGDCNENGIGDVCECYMDGNEDGRVTAPDYAILKSEFGRYDCLLSP